MATHPIFESDFDCLTEARDGYRIQQSRFTCRSKWHPIYRRHSRKSSLRFAIEIASSPRCYPKERTTQLHQKHSLPKGWIKIFTPPKTIRLGPTQQRCLLGCLEIRSLPCTNLPCRFGRICWSFVGCQLCLWR